MVRVTNFMIRRERHVKKSIPESTRQYLREAQELAKTDSASSGKKYLAVAELQLQTDDYRRARFNYGKAEAQFKKAGIVAKIIETLDGQAECYRKLDMFVKARECYTKALDYALAGNKDVAVAFHYFEIGTTYLMEAESSDEPAANSLLLNSAVTWLKKANTKFELISAAHPRGTKEASEQEVGRNKCQVALNFAIVTRFMRDYGKATSYFNTALQLARRFGAGDLEIRIQINMGLSYRDQGLYTEALACFEKAFKKCGKDHQEEQAGIHSDKGITLQLKGDYDGGLGELRKSREMWLQLGDQGQVDSMDEAISTLRETQELHARIKQLCESALAAKNAGDAEKEFRAWIDLYFAFKSLPTSSNQEQLTLTCVRAMESINSLWPLYNPIAPETCVFSEVCHDLGTCYYRLRKYEDAVKAHTKELNFADTMSRKAIAFGAIAEAKSAAGAPFEDTAGILLDQVEYAMRADEIHLEHQAIQRWIELHKSQGRTSEKMPELEERLKELAAEIKNMEDDEQLSDDEEDDESDEVSLMGTGNEENKRPNQSAGNAKGGSRAKRASEAEPDHVSISSDDDAEDDDEDSPPVVLRRVRRKVSLESDEEGDEKATRAASAPSRRNTDEETAAGTPEPSDHTIVRPSPAHEKLGDTLPKPGTEATLRIRVCVSGSEDAVVVPCTIGDSRLEWLITEAQSRLEEILERPIVIKRLTMPDGTALSKRDAISAVLRDMDTVMAIVQ